ncbi:hypothetical protein Pmani_015632 [Petrolisthes manimaculis]|uniref:Uncharacterized protein n=1 Tax=Petrolisthes manimaculis TaxID=1843537 RepID=A0AAE1PU02_9EUCA|nr:hypothetical protein Pmani_015632 [Petrolisthes manimaculis]
MNSSIENLKWLDVPQHKKVPSTRQGAIPRKDGDGTSSPQLSVSPGRQCPDPEPQPDYQLTTKGKRIQRNYEIVKW